MFIKKKKLEKLSAVLIECMIERLAVDKSGLRRLLCLERLTLLYSLLLIVPATPWPYFKVKSKHTLYCSKVL